MNHLLRYVALPVLVAMVMLAGLYLSAGGRLDRHFHGSIVDRSPQASIHVVAMDSGFHLRQTIETSKLDHVSQRLQQAPLCIWLRMEYPRNSSVWTTSGTIELRMSIPDKAWTTRFTSDQITTYFQPFCFKDAQAKEVFDQPAFLDISVVEPDLKRVAMIALGPGNGQNNAEINGQRSELTATYTLTADPGPSREDVARFILMGLSSMALLLCVLIPMTGRTARPDPTSPHHLESRPS